MANQLFDIDVLEVSLVDKGASGDEDASHRPRIVIAKRCIAAKENSMKTVEEVLAGLDEEARATIMSALQSAAAPAPVAAPAPAPVAPAPAAAMAVPAKAEGEEKDEEEKPEEMAKRLIDAGFAVDVAKRIVEDRSELVEVRKQVAKLEDANELRTFVAKAAELDALPGMSTEDRGQLLMTAKRNLPEAAYTQLEESLKSAAVAVAKSAIFSEVGSGGAGDTSAMGELVSIAKALQEKDPTLSESASKMRASELNPALYERAQAGE